MKNAVLLATPLLFLGLAASAQPAPRDEQKAVRPPGWIETTNNHCKVWNPEPQINESVTWSGDCKDGYASGKGVLKWTLNGKPDIVFEGVYDKGKRNGPGVITTPEGQRFQGLWMNDEAIPPAGNSI
jgi:hypothetical protein